jgi:hypothetical protein
VTGDAAGAAAGAAADRQGIIERFASFPARLAEAARAADGRPVPAGEWTPELVVRHLIAVEGEVWRSRLAELAAGGEPRWSRVEPGPGPGSPDASLDDFLDVFSDLRTGTVGFLRVFDLEPDGWSRTGIHAIYGRLDVVGLLGVAIDHDEEHLGSLGLEP